jgi:L-asparaginase
MALPRILLVGTGGTITMTPGGAGIVPTLAGDDLVRAVPDLARHANLEVVSYSAKPGASLTLEDLVAIADVVDGRLRDGCAGAVVVQGTDTIEESAFVLDLLVTSDRPVVVTGAMRGAAMPGADGPANLLAAVIVACSEGAIGLGTLVVLNDEVHAARFVRKMHTASPSAFASPGAGPLGAVVEGALVRNGRLERTPMLPRPANLADWPVALAGVVLGDDGRLLRALPSLGYRGVVLEAMGAGHVPAALVPAIQALAGAVPVVLATRVPAGRVFTRTYAFPGSETDLAARGVVAAGGLAPAKAVQLLRLLLAQPARSAPVTDHFARYAEQRA